MMFNVYFNYLQSYIPNRKPANLASVWIRYQKNVLFWSRQKWFNALLGAKAENRFAWR